METTIFRNHEKLQQSEVNELFGKKLSDYTVFSGSEIEELAEAYAKNPVDKFIISERPDGEASQGDILVFAEGTDMYNEISSTLQKMTETERLVLQEGDSMTGDHRVVPLEGSKYSVKTGKFTPAFLKGKNSWGREPEYTAVSLEIDKPFLIVHREHGNMALPCGKYLFCTQLDAATLERIMD